MFENISKFKPSEKFSEYIENIISKLIEDNDLENKDDIIYLSAPMTGVDNYHEKFIQMKDTVKYIFYERNICIIDPSSIIDNIPEDLEATYIDIMFLCFKLLNICDMIIVDDSTDKWVESRGVLTELLYSKNNGINIYGMDWLYNANRFRRYLDCYDDYTIPKDIEIKKEYDTIFQKE